jgi:DNA modification methylase
MACIKDGAVLMEPYYQDAQCTIYNADCREVLPILAADVVLTDPPYGLNVEYDGYEDTESNLHDLVSEVMPLMLSVAPVVALTPGITQLHLYPKATWCLAWTWPHTGTWGKWGFSQWGPILVYGPDPFLRMGKGARPDLIRCGATQAVGAAEYVPVGHPCPKPLVAWRQILERVSPDPNALVLDPFMGTGTTLRAAKDLGRKSIGVEMSERYCEIAAKRLAQEVLF